MRRMSKFFSLLLAVTIALTALTAVAAIPENGGKGTKLAFSGITQSQGQGSTATVADDTFGTIYRMTNSGGTYYRPYLEFAKTQNLLYSAGDYLYISFYWRAIDGESPATYFNTAVSFENFAAPAKSIGTSAAMNYGSWNKMEMVLPNNADRTWTNMRLPLQFGGSDTTARVIDITAPVCYYLGAATGDSEDAILAEFRQTFSNDSSIAALTVGGTSVDLTANPSSYDAGAVTLTLADVEVTPTSADAFVVKEEVGEGVFKITVYSQAANIVSPNSGETTSYTVTYSKEEINIPENGGKGTKLAFSGIVHSQGQGSIATVADDTFGTICRMTNSGGTYYRPYLEFAKTMNLLYSAGDYLYISFYWRALDGESPATYFNAAVSFENFAVPAKSIGTSAAMNYGSWNKAEMVLPNNADRTWTDMRLSLQFGGSDATARVIDIAAPVCYYLGAATGGDADAILTEFRKTFSSDSSIAALTVGGTSVDLAANPSSYDAGKANITSANVSVIVSEGAYVIKSDAAGEIKITVYPQNANILNAAQDKTEYIITYSELTLEKAGNSSTAGTIRFATKLTVPEGKDVEYYGTFMIPESIFSDPQADALKVDARGTETITSGQIYGADLTGIPNEFYATPIYAWSYVKFTGDENVRTLVLDSASVNNPLGQ
ncbi:MAG: hypothetical protein Q4C12_08760 [Clostridia bacterium]|nr:hypothetical protein [Clostridia bacterium]